jgi:hypothetical protein
MGSDLHLHPPSRNRIIKFIHVTCCRWHSLLQRAGGCYEMLLPERTSLHLSQDKRKLICKLQAPNAQRRLCRGGGRQSSSQRRRMSLVVSSTAARVDVTGFKGTTLVDQNRPRPIKTPFRRRITACWHGNWFAPGEVHTRTDPWLQRDDKLRDGTESGNIMCLQSRKKTSPVRA